MFYIFCIIYSVLYTIYSLLFSILLYSKLLYSILLYSIPLDSILLSYPFKGPFIYGEQTRDSAG